LTGKFKNGIKDSIWTYTNGKSKTQINYENGKINGPTLIYADQSKLNIKSKNSYRRLFDLDYFYNNETNLLSNYYIDSTFSIFKDKNKSYLKERLLFKDNEQTGWQEYYYPNGKLLKKEHIESKEKLILSPFNDTIYYQYNDNGFLISKTFNKLGLSKIKTSKNDTTATINFSNGIKTKVDSTYNYELIGVSISYNEEGKLLELIDYNNSKYILNLHKDSSGLYRYGTYSRINNKESCQHYKTISYQNGIKSYEGWIFYPRDYYRIKNNYDQYEIRDTFLVYHPNQQIKQHIFIDTLPLSDGTSWVKEYYEDGSPKSEGTVTNYSFEKACEEDIYLPVFEFTPTNFWTRAGEQTMRNGTGTIFYKEEGTPKYEGQLKDGKKIGIWKYYDGNGNLNKFGSYVNGKKDGVWYAGDLKHIHYVNECLDTSSPKYEERKKQLEQQINISVSIFKNGTKIVSDSFKRD